MNSSMPDLTSAKSALDETSSIRAFLSKIGITGSSTTRPEDVANKVRELNIQERDVKANSTVALSIPSRVVSHVASPESVVSESVSPENVSEWIAVHAPADHFKTKNPLVGSVQAQEIQASPQGSPQSPGVVAPPPTPETISNLAIGKMIHDELDRIPDERFMSLGDSKFAPHNQSRLRNTRLASNERFLSAVPQATKPRDDPGFTRMSFKAADAPSVPSWFNVPESDAKATDMTIHPGQDPPLSAEHGKENAPPKTTKDGWSQTAATSGSASVLMSERRNERRDAIIRKRKEDRADEKRKGQERDTRAPDTPPSAPQLKPIHIEEAKTTKVFVPDTPEATPVVDPLALDTKPLYGGEVRAAIQGPRAQVNPFSTTNVSRASKENKDRATAIAIAKPIVNVKTANLAGESPDASAVPLTPSSMTFTAVSPTKVRAAGITTSNHRPAKVVGENLEGALYLKAWPSQGKSEERASRTAAKHRRIILTGLPESSTPNFIASIVHGGALESIRTTEGKVAYVTFLRSEDAMTFYEATGNDLVFEKDGKQHVITTGLGKDVDPVSGVLKEWIEKEFTRCVRAVGVDEDWTMQALSETAAKKGRKVEKVVDGSNKSGMRSVTFRFCDIADAVKFKQTLSRSEDWEECNIHFAPDPSADATGIHFE